MDPELSPASRRALALLAKNESIPIDSLHGASVRALIGRGLAEEDGDVLRLTTAGREASGAKPTTPTPPAPPPVAPVKKNGRLDDSTYRHIREEIQARYQADLDALDRVWEIVKAVGA